MKLNQMGGMGGQRSLMVGTLALSSISKERESGQRLQKFNTTHIVLDRKPAATKKLTQLVVIISFQKLVNESRVNLPSLGSS